MSQLEILALEMDREGRFPPPLPPPPPPYPRRLSAISLMGAVVCPQNKKEGTKSMVGGIRGRTYYFRRCKKVEATNIESLPNEVLIEIIVRLSIDEILEKDRFVCRKWYHFIHSDALINAHREYSNSNSNWGLLLTNKDVSEQPMFLGVNKGGRIELSKLYHRSYVPVLVSCNGLAVSYRGLSRSIQLLNLATKQAFRSPPALPRGQRKRSFGMAYAAASMEYKLVRTYENNFSTPRVCHILTAGVDNNWRIVGIDHLSCGAKKLLIRVPLITEGFMHWTWEWEGTRVLTLNAETEMFTESYVPLHPHPLDDDFTTSAHLEGTRRRPMFYVSTGRRLCLFSPCGDWEWEVWEMEGESGEWSKLLPNIDLEAQMRRVRQELPCDNTSGFLEPLGWVKYPVLLALCFVTTCMVYNLATGEIDYSFELTRPCRCYNAVVHNNTLEWLR